MKLKTWKRISIASLFLLILLFFPMGSEGKAAAAKEQGPPPVEKITVIPKEMRILVKWTPSPGADGYRVDVREVRSSHHYSTYRGKNSCYYFCEDALNGMLFYFHVYPYYKRNGKIIFGSAKTYGYGSCLPDPPQKVQNLTLKKVNGANVELRWDTVQKNVFKETIIPSGYIIYRKASDSKRPVEIARVPYSTNRYTDIIKKEDRYFYWVAAYIKGIPSVDSVGELSDYRGIYAYRTIPERVKDLQFKRKGNFVNLKWSPTKDAEYYLIYRRTPEENTFKYLYIKKDTSYTDQLKETGYYYFYTIYAARKQNGKLVLAPMGNSVYCSGRTLSEKEYRVIRSILSKKMKYVDGVPYYTEDFVKNIPSWIQRTRSNKNAAYGYERTPELIDSLPMPDSDIVREYSKERRKYWENNLKDDGRLTPEQKRERINRNVIYDTKKHFYWEPLPKNIYKSARSFISMTKIAKIQYQVTPEGINLEARAKELIPDGLKQGDGKLGQKLLTSGYNEYIKRISVPAEDYNLKTIASILKDSYYINYDYDIFFSGEKKLYIGLALDLTYPNPKRHTDSDFGPRSPVTLL